MNETAESWEDKFRAAARKAFEKDRRETLAYLHEGKVTALKQKASVNWQNLQTDTLNYYRNNSVENWRGQFVPLIEGVMSDSGENLKTTFGFQFDVPNIGSMEFFDEYVYQFAQPINQTTQDGLNDLFMQAQSEGWTISEMEKHIEQLFKQWMAGDGTSEDWEWYAQRLPAHRLEMIARTETMKASNAGNTAIMLEWGVEKKEWLATGDDRTRESHIQAWIDYSDGNAILMDQPFIVDGEELMYPGDPAGSAGNVIFCRCTLIPSLESSEVNTPPDWMLDEQ